MNGHELNTDLLWQAYQEGIFPMTAEDDLIEWYISHNRALLPIEGIHVSKSLHHVLKKADFKVTFDKDYHGVMRSCLRPSGNWISEDIIRVFCQAHGEGWGHSCEVWREDRLVAGVYGLTVGGYFAAESMFHHDTDMSKVALKCLVDRAREEGCTLFDGQIMNPHLETLGAYSVPHRSFKTLLRRAIKIKTAWGQRHDGSKPATAQADRIDPADGS